jgi:hypothetical protein
MTNIGKIKLKNKFFFTIIAITYPYITKLQEKASALERDVQHFKP